MTGYDLKNERAVLRSNWNWMKSCMISSGSVYFVKVRTLLWLWVVCGYKIKIYAQMLALVYISQIVPYFSLFWQFYGWHNTKSKQAHTNHRMCRRENSPRLNKLLFTLQIANEGWGGFYPHKIFKLHPTLDISEQRPHTGDGRWSTMRLRDQANTEIRVCTCNLIYVVSVQFLNIITLKWLDCVIIRVAERQAKYDHYSCYYFLWSSRTMVVMINEASQHSGTLYTLSLHGSFVHGSAVLLQLSITTKSIARSQMK